MDFNNKPTLNYGKEIKILAISALVLKVLLFILNFAGFSSILSLFLNLIPFALFLVYIFYFHEKMEATVLVPIIFGSFSLIGMIEIILSGRGLSGMIGGIMLLISGIVGLVGALKGFDNKYFVIASTALYVLAYLLSAIILFMVYYLFSVHNTIMFIINFGAHALLGAALLLFGLKNKIPTILVTSPGVKKSEEKINIEQDLKSLLYLRDSGVIDEEEYQRRRAEIIKNL